MNVCQKNVVVVPHVDTLSPVESINCMNFDLDCRSFEYPVKDMLRDGVNTLTIVIDPATNVSLARKQSNPYTINTLAVSEF